MCNSLSKDVVLSPTAYPRDGDRFTSRDPLCVCVCVCVCFVVVVVVVVCLFVCLFVCFSVAAAISGTPPFGMKNKNYVDTGTNILKNTKTYMLYY